MYVVHVPLGLFVLSPLAARWGWLSTGSSALLQCLYMLMCVLASYGVAVLIYHGVERHFLALKSRRWASVGPDAASRA